MSDAPKRIWARPADATARSFDGNLTGGWSVHKGYVSGPCEEYAPAAELDRLRAENERLKRALVEAMIVPEAFMISGRPAHMRDDVWEQMQRSVEIARAALQAKGDGKNE